MTHNCLVLEYVSTGIFILNTRLEVELWNTWLEDLTGIKKSDIEGKVINKFFPAFTDELVQYRLQSVFENGTPVIFSSSLNHNLLATEDKSNKEANVYEITVSGIPPTDGTSDMYALFTVENVTDLKIKIDKLKELNKKSASEIEQRRQAEISLINTQHQLEETNRAKDKFIQILGHDLKNLLSGVLSFSGLLTENYNAYSKKQVQTFLHKMHENIKRTFHLLENLVIWGKTSKHNYLPKLELMSLGEVVNEALMAVNSQALEKEILMQNNTPALLQLFSDKVFIQTIIRNLVNNAIKYTQSGGVVTINASADIEYTTIEVNDTGVGMDRQQAARLFKMDEFNSEPGTNDEKGTGMGLLICKEMVHKLDGSIWLTSEAGKGTSVYVRIPIKKPEI